MPACIEIILLLKHFFLCKTINVDIALVSPGLILRYCGEFHVFTMVSSRSSGFLLLTRTIAINIPY